VRHPHFVDSVAVGIASVIGEKIDELGLVADDVAIQIARLVKLAASLVVRADVPPPANRLDAGWEILGAGDRGREQDAENGESNERRTGSLPTTPCAGSQGTHSHGKPPSCGVNVKPVATGLKR
jgi:hypothetical protein